MIWLLATALLGVAAPFVLWPLISHWQPEGAQDSAGPAPRERERDLEEIDLDLAAGRLSESEAALRRREAPAPGSDR